MPSGKEAFDYRNRYVCTEKDDQEITDDLPYWCPLPRPHPTPAPCPHWKDARNLKSDFRDQIKGDHYCNLEAPCPQHQIWQHCPVAGEIARKAREDVLDKVVAWERKHGYWFTINGISGEKRYHFEPDRFEEFIKEIRHNAPQTKEDQR